jgi:2-hydroxychromene-2-carboxylate isomerase
MNATKPTASKLTWYFDFISPYAYLQSEQLDQFQAIDGEPLPALELKPILFAGLLKHWGQLGPAEIVPKRQWTFEQVVWQAHQHQIPITMPPAHPFNPLPFLRLAIACECSRHAVREIFRFIWVKGYAFENQQAFDALLASLNKTRADLEIARVKERLKLNTEQAIGDSIFGVPTLLVQAAGRDAQRFWGFDSSAMALSYLKGDPFWSSQALAQAQALPDGLQRKRD